MPICLSEIREIPNEFSRLIVYIHNRQPSNISLIAGFRGTGKTSKMLAIMEILYKYDIIKEFATNTAILKSPFPIEQINDLQTLKVWGKSSDNKKLFGFDEIGNAMARRTPMSKLNVDLLKMFQRIRKFKLSTVCTTITEDQTDSSILNPLFLDGWFNCPYWDNPKVVLYEDFRERFFRSYTGLHDTSIKFDTYDTSEFTERNPNAKPIFKEKELELLWQMTHGHTTESLGLSYMQAKRIRDKYLKQFLETHYQPNSI